MRFVVNKVALGQGFLPVLYSSPVSIIPPSLHTHLPSSIPIYIQQDAALHSLFYLEIALRVSGGTTTHHQKRKLLYLQHLVFVTPLLLPAAIVEELELV